MVLMLLLVLMVPSVMKVSCDGTRCPVWHASRPAEQQYSVGSSGLGEVDPFISDLPVASANTSTSSCCCNHHA